MKQESLIIFKMVLWLIILAWPNYGQSNPPVPSSTTGQVLGDHSQNSTTTSVVDLGAALLELYPPNQYAYVSLGRSPTPVHAFLWQMKKSGHPIYAEALPFSSASSMPAYLRYDRVASQDRTHYVKKLFDHFEDYLGGLLNRMAKEPNAPQKIVLIDFAVSGKSLGIGKRYLDLFLRYRLSTTGAKSPIPTEFLAIIDQEIGIPGHSQSVFRTIRNFKKPYVSSISGQQELLAVPSGEADGRIPVKIDMNQLTKRMNRFTTEDEWHWRGRVISIDPETDQAFAAGLFNQEFDYASPYGSWKLVSGELVRHLPSVAFKRMASTFLDYIPEGSSAAACN